MSNLELLPARAQGASGRVKRYGGAKTRHGAASGGEGMRLTGREAVRALAFAISATAGVGWMHQSVPCSIIARLVFRLGADGAGGWPGRTVGRLWEVRQGQPNAARQPTRTGCNRHVGTNARSPGHKLRCRPPKRVRSTASTRYHHRYRPTMRTVVLPVSESDNQAHTLLRFSFMLTPSVSLLPCHDLVPVPSVLVPILVPARRGTSELSNSLLGAAVIGVTNCSRFGDRGCPCPDCSADSRAHPAQ